MNLDIVEFSRQQIQEGSKSFSFASFFFSKRERSAAWLLYSWCRHCDDEIDKAGDIEQALHRLIALEEGTRQAYSSATSLSNPHFEGLRLIAREFNIPMRYPMELLRGMRMDVEGREYQTVADLKDYCYCVAGVVGLMMCHIMGVSQERALKHAVALGEAMQMTNIARDVLDDWNLGRIYFPKVWQY